MQAAQQRPGAHTKALADATAGQWYRGRHDEAGQIGE